MNRPVRLLLPLVALGAIMAVVRSDVTSAAPGDGTPTLTPNHFSHLKHKARLDVSKCEDCHAIDAKGGIVAPAAQGHAPCLRSGCHADDPLKTKAPSFLAVSKANSESKDPKVLAAFQRAGAFCLGCHEQVPWPWKKPTVRVVATWLQQTEHHLEMARTDKSSMDHWMHTKQEKNGKPLGCKGCHLMGGGGQGHDKGSPGHSQCVQCHNASDGEAFAMNECSRCHKDGPRDAWIRSVVKPKSRGYDLPSRQDSSVVSCGSARDAALKNPNKNAKCFKHESDAHAKIDCGTCHWMVVQMRDRYGNLAQLHQNKIVGDLGSDLEKQHAACSTSGCHRKEFNSGETGCQSCHPHLEEKW